jgi:hypothetical protein
MGGTEPAGKPSRSPLAPGFHRLDMESRRRETQAAFSIGVEEWESLSGSAPLREISDVMVESAVGCMPVQIGRASCRERV